METGRIVWLVIATITILGFSQARYIVEDKSIDDKNEATDEDYIPVVNEQPIEDVHEAATTDDKVLRSTKTIKPLPVSILVDRSHKPESPNADKGTARRDRSNILRSKTGHRIVKRDPPQWKTLLFG